MIIGLEPIGQDTNVLPAMRIRRKNSVPGLLGRGDEQMVGGLVPVVQVDGVGERAAP